MLCDSLLNDQITSEIINSLIKKSANEYSKFLKYDLSDESTRRGIIQFISDDIYEFDTIMNHNETMINIYGFDENKKQIQNSINSYNSTITTNNRIYIMLLNLMKYYDADTQEAMFLQKVINGYTKKLKESEKNIIKINSEIETLEKKLIYIHQYQKKLLELSQNEIAGFPPDLSEKFYDKSKKKFIFYLDQQVYSLCHKYLIKSNVRKKVDDVYFENCSSVINMMANLFILRNKRAELLGYSNHIAYSSQDVANKSFEVMKKVFEKMNMIDHTDLMKISELKKTCENSDELYTWDLMHYVTRLKSNYNLNIQQLSEYFELEETLNKIISFYSAIFPVSFKRTHEINKGDYAYKIKINGTSHRYIILNLFKNANKEQMTKSTCVSSVCNYPNQKNIKSTSLVYILMNLVKQTPTLLSFMETLELFREIGKSIFYSIGDQKYSLSGGSYKSIEDVDTVSILFELIFLNKSVIQNISKNYKSGKQLEQQTIETLLAYINSDFTINYKNKYLCTIYNAIVHASSDFLDQCKTKNDVTSIMKSTYHELFKPIYENSKYEIFTDIEHFHPSAWTYMFSGHDNVQFIKLYSEVCAHTIYEKFYSKGNYNGLFQLLEEPSICVEPNVDHLINYVKKMHSHVPPVKCVQTVVQDSEQYNHVYMITETEDIDEKN